MAKKRINVGLYISNEDVDIASWINHLKKNNENPAKWVSALIVAEQAGKTPLYLPNPQAHPQTIVRNTAPSQQNINLKPSVIMFGAGSSIAEESVPNNGWKYGWQVKGEQGEFIHGSVINLSFCRPEIVALLLEFKEHGCKIATYIKALIHRNLSAGSNCTELTNQLLETMLRDFYVQSINNLHKPETLEAATSPVSVNASEALALPKVQDSPEFIPTPPIESKLELGVELNPLIGFIN